MLLAPTLGLAQLVAQRRDHVPAEPLDLLLPLGPAAAMELEGHVLDADLPTWVPIPALADLLDQLTCTRCCVLV